MDSRDALLTAVGGHLLLTILHGIVHAIISVFLAGWKMTLAAVLLFLLPVLGLGLVLRGYRWVGALCLLGAGLGGFAFEGLLHFIVPNPDHVAHVTDHRIAFGLTAVLTTVGNLFLLGAAWYSVHVN